MRSLFKDLKLRVVLILCVPVLAVSAIVLVDQFRSRPLPSLENVSTLSFGDERNVWTAYIEAKGGAEAWQIFKDVYNDTDILQAHSHAHVFGEALYDVEGVSGVAACDSSFSFGCYHSFFGKAIATEGMPVISELDQRCVERWGLKGLGCPHGIGHGLLWYMGADHLNEALEACATLSWKGPIGGCSSGVFMEYNFQTMKDPSMRTPRTFDEQKPFSPCDTIPERFQQGCYFELPQWWAIVLEKDYTRLGGYCAALTKPELREACYRGLGSIIAPNSHFSVPDSIGSCRLMPDETSNELCLEGVSWGFTAEPSQRSHASLICGSLPEGKRTHCDEGADLHDDRENFVE